MRFSVVTPNYNGASFLEETICSVVQQKKSGIDLEYIIVDGGSSDGSHAIIERYRDEIDRLIIEEDTGPANAINKGLALASGDVVSWLNADDIYCVDVLKRVQKTLAMAPNASFCFGRCPIVNENGDEIRQAITRFKEMFYPISSRFTFQVINYISQPAMFFRKKACAQNKFLREDMVAAWDYEFLLRLWAQGNGVCIPGGPVSAFRWHEQSISGQNFQLQFKEELEAAAMDAGKWSPQILLHHCVRWGIIGAYTGMSVLRQLKK